MRRLGTLVVLFALAASPLYAQGRGRNNNSSQGIPPGQLPPAGMCRVWYDGVAPGRQPRPTNCRDAERAASRDRNARVIYGSDRNNDVYDRSNNVYNGNDRVYDRGSYGNRGGYANNNS